MRCIEWNLARLKEMGIIERVGSGKNEYWKIIKKIE